MYYVLPSRECAKCHTTISEFWANSCNSCLSGMGDSIINYNANDMDATYMVITDPELIKRFSSETAWICTAPMGNGGSLCQFINGEQDEFCTNPVCSTPRIECGKDIPKQTINQFGTFSTASKAAGVIEYLNASDSKSVSMTIGGKLPKGGLREIHTLFNGTVKIIVTATAVAIVSFQGYQWFHPVTLQGTVESTHWETTVSIEKLTAVNDSGWSAPSDAYNVSWTNKISGYETVNTGTYHTENFTAYRTVSDGYETKDCSTTSGSLVVVKTCEVPKYKSESYQDSKQVADTKEVPVEEKWYTYTQDRWLSERTLPMIGNNSPIKFADTILMSNERANNSCSANLVTVGNDGETYKVPVICAELPSYHAGQDHISFQHNKAGMNWSPEHLD
jgi:hypothetical protein